MLGLRATAGGAGGVKSDAKEGAAAGGALGEVAGDMHQRRHEIMFGKEHSETRL